MHLDDIVDDTSDHGTELFLDLSGKGCGLMHTHISIFQYIQQMDRSSCTEEQNLGLQPLSITTQYCSPRESHTCKLGWAVEICRQVTPSKEIKKLQSILQHTHAEFQAEGYIQSWNHKCLSHEWICWSCKWLLDCGMISALLWKRKKLWITFLHMHPMFHKVDAQPTCFLYPKHW